MKLDGIMLFMIIIIAFHLDGCAQIPKGVVKEGLIIRSKVLKKDIRYTIYLPFDYTSSSRYYPVVYLLHGFTDNDMAWIQFGEAHLTADEAIEKKQIPPR